MYRVINKPGMDDSNGASRGQEEGKNGLVMFQKICKASFAFNSKKTNILRLLSEIHEEKTLVLLNKG